MRQAGVLTAAAQVAVDEQFGDGEWGSKSGKLRVVHERAKRVGRMWEARGGRLQKPVQTNQVWLDLDGLGVTAEEWNNIGEYRGLLLDGPRLVLHHQITEDAIDRLDLAFADLENERKAEEKQQRQNQNLINSQQKNARQNGI